MSLSKRILFLSETLNVGGAEKALVNIFKRYSHVNIDLMLISGTGGFLNEIIGIKDLKLRFYTGPSKSIVKSIFNAFKIKLLYKWLPASISGNYLCRGYDVVVAFCEGFLTKWVAASTVSCKKIAWVHTDMINNDWPITTGVFHSVEEEKDAYQKFDHVVAVSNVVSEGMKSKFGINNISTIYNLLDPDIIKKAGVGENNRLKFRLNLVSVGRLEKVKGYDNLINAIGSLSKQQGLDISLTLIGGGSQRYELEKLAEELNISNRIFFAGSQPNPYPYIKAADVYVCSSLQEGFNVAILEAMTLGKPIITTDSAGPREILDGGKYGILVDNNVHGLVDGISLVYSVGGLANKFSEISTRRAKEFSSEEQIKKINELIANI